MTSTPRSTRSRTRALRKFSGDKPKLDSLDSSSPPPSPPPTAADSPQVNSPENDHLLWEDVSDTADEGDFGTKSVQSNVSSSNTSSAVRRTGTKVRSRRKRAGGIQSPVRKQTPVLAAAAYPPSTPTRQTRGKVLSSQEVLQLEALSESEPNYVIFDLPEKKKREEEEEEEEMLPSREMRQKIPAREMYQDKPKYTRERTLSQEPQATAPPHEKQSNGRTLPTTTTHKKENSLSKISTEEIVDGAMQGVSFGSWYIFDVVRTALTLLRKPLGLVLFLWVLAMILLTISHTLRTAFAPLCWVPGLSSSIMCRRIPSSPFSSSLPQGADYPRLMEAQTKTFEQLLDETSGGSALSLEVKKAEMATIDLAVVVRISTLRSKDILADMLSDFVQDAKKTARRLQRLHSKVGGSVDSIMAVNDHALRTIEAANSKNNIISLHTLIPWKQSLKNQVIASTFQDAMDTLSAQIARLILETEVNVENLNELEERLNGIHELVSREVKSVKGDRDELLAQLWTVLGGNRKGLRSFNENLVTLSDIGKYRHQARMHVTATLQTLYSLSEDMEELRERVATPGLVGESIPLEVQMKSIQYGLDRLKENRIRARRIHEAAIEGVVGMKLSEIGA